jgi:hypothetical protein
MKARRRSLTSYFDYYHRSRTHLSLGKDSPDPDPFSRRKSGQSRQCLRSADCTTDTNDEPPKTPKARVQLLLSLLKSVCIVLTRSRPHSDFFLQTRKCDTNTQTAREIHGSSGNGAR